MFTKKCNSYVNVFLRFVRVFVVRVRVPRYKESLPLGVVYRVSIFQGNVLVPIRVQDFMKASVSPYTILRAYHYHQYVIIFLFPLYALHYFRLGKVLVVLYRLVVWGNGVHELRALGFSVCSFTQSRIVGS